MSVSFDVEAIALGTYTVTCPDTDVTFARDLGYDAIQPLITAHQGECAECANYRPFAEPDLDIQVEGINVSNASASQLLMHLELPFDGESELAGNEDGAVFLARVIVALASVTEVSNAYVPATDDGRTFFGERRAGYVSERLEQLHALASEAARLGRSIFWA